MPDLYADLHCHPALYGFNRMRNGPFEADPETFNPWHGLDVDRKALAKGARASGYTQCTPPMLVDSRTRVVFASITPIEKGFFVGNIEEARETDFSVELFKLMSGVSLASAAGKFARGRRLEAGAEVARVLKNRGPLRLALQKAVLRYGLDRVRFLRSDAYDYWQEFLREYAFYQNADGLRTTGISPQAHGREESVEGCYHIVRDAEHLFEIVASEDVAIILTIEGAHTFTVAPDETRLDLDTILERVEILRQFEHPIVFVTLAHHFDNGICGHARSLPDNAGWVMDQSRRMGEGLDPEVGLTVVRELLDLDAALRPRGGRRIHLDCKHMSPATRQQYYRDVLRPYNEWAANNGEAKIPVIISHSAYSGVATLAELRENSELEGDHWHRSPFLAWGINHSDEDVREVWASNGLIGLVFDQRVCGVKPRESVPRRAWGRILANHLFATVDVILLDERIPAAERKRVWDCVCFGSDYDGFIDPLTAYPTVTYLDELAGDLRTLLEERAHTRFIAEIGVDELVEKICWRNAYELAVRLLP